MRLHSLGLTRYGRFTDFTLEFGDRPATGPDIHLIYGPNEAGKSTIFSGLIDFLFGIDTRSPYAFLHAYDAMRIDGLAEVADAQFSLSRIKKPRNSLLGADGNAVPESVFGDLTDLGKSGYAAMFSLDDDSLRKGAKDLLDAKGDFGEILFGASTGLAAVSERLSAMRAEADGIHRPNARNTLLNDLTRKIDVLRKEKAEADISAPAFAEQAKARDAAKETATQAEASETEARRMFARLQRLESGLAPLANLDRDRTALAALGNGVETPAGWRERATALSLNEKAVATRSKDVEASLAKLTADLDRLPLDPSLISAADRIKTLEGMASRYATAVDDIPKRLASADDLAASAAKVAILLGQQDITEPGDLLLPTATVSALNDLLTEWPKLTTQVESAEAEWARAETEAKSVDSIVLSPSARAALSAALETANRSTAIADATSAKRRVRDLEQRLANGLAGLTPWVGDADALTALAPPAPATITRWRKTRDEWDAVARDIRAEQQHLRAEALKLRQGRLEAEVGTEVLDDAAFRNLRQDRDTCWQSHLQMLDEQSANVFANIMADVDKAVDTRLNAAEAVARLSQLSVSEAKLQIAEQTISARVAEDKSAVTALIAEWTSVATALGLPATTGLDELAEWLDQRTATLSEKADLEAERHTALENARQAQSERQSLLTALGDASGAGDVLENPAILTLAREALEQAALGQKTAADFAARQEDVETARTAMTAWEQRWKQALAGTWLEGSAGSPNSVSAAVGELAALRGTIRERDDLRRRIDEMRRDQESFKETLISLSASLDMLLDDDLLAMAQSIRQRLRIARETVVRETDLRHQVEAATEDLAKRQQEQAAHQASVAEMAAHFGVDDLAAVMAAMDAADSRLRLIDQIIQAEDAVRRAGDGDNLVETEDTLRAATADDLKAKIAQQEGTVETLAAEAREAHHASRTAQGAIDAIAGDADAARLEQARQTAVMEIEDAARRYLRLKLGTMAADRALARYRQKHRSQMLERASATFARITRGSFSGLTTQPGDGRETLVALRAEGASAMDDVGMSVATRAQLYLALRVAAYHELADRGQPLPPFVADDIIETFDNERAAETLQVLGEMAELGQVIYLTHHQHLIPIAEAAAPGIKLHRLPDPAAALA